MYNTGMTPTNDSVIDPDDFSTLPRKQNGVMIASLIVLVILVFGAVYLFAERLHAQHAAPRTIIIPGTTTIEIKK